MLDPDCLQRRIMDWEKSKELDKGMMILYIWVFSHTARSERPSDTNSIQKISLN